MRDNHYLPLGGGGGRGGLGGGRGRGRGGGVGKDHCVGAEAYCIYVGCIYMRRWDGNWSCNAQTMWVVLHIGLVGNNNLRNVTFSNSRSMLIPNGNCDSIKYKVYVNKHTIMGS